LAASCLLPPLLLPLHHACMQVYYPEGLWRPRIVLTIHNMENTGECRQDEFYYAGLPGEMFAQVSSSSGAPHTLVWRV
jgi:hypothetical protein